MNWSRDSCTPRLETNEYREWTTMIGVQCTSTSANASLALAGSRRSSVPAVDGFRGLAALLVVFYHIFLGSAGPAMDHGPIRNIVSSGYLGVDFFFVISGFLLFLPTALANGTFGSVRSYAIRRAARIIPAYYLILCIGIAAVPLLTEVHVDLPYDSEKGVASLLLHLSFLHHTAGYMLKFPDGFYVNGVVWTLSLEVAFYVLLPFIAERFFRNPFRWLAIFLTISVLWRWSSVSYSIQPWKLTEGKQLFLTSQFPYYLVNFGFGMTSAWIFVYLSARQWIGRWRLIFIPLQVGSFAMVVWGMDRNGARDLVATAGIHNHWKVTLIIAAGFAMLMLATALAPGWAQIVFTNRVSRKLGDISYSMYLWHLLLIGFALTSLNFVPSATNGAYLKMVAFVLPATIILAWMTFVLVERPCISWARRRTSKSLQPGATLKSN